MENHFKLLSNLLIVVIVILFIVCLIKINKINKEINIIKEDIEENLRKNNEEYHIIYDILDYFGDNWIKTRAEQGE